MSFTHVNTIKGPSNLPCITSLVTCLTIKVIPSMVTTRALCVWCDVNKNRWGSVMPKLARDIRRGWRHSQKP